MWTSRRDIILTLLTASNVYLIGGTTPEYNNTEPVSVPGTKTTVTKITTKAHLPVSHTRPVTTRPSKKTTKPHMRVSTPGKPTTRNATTMEPITSTFTTKKPTTTVKTSTITSPTDSTKVKVTTLIPGTTTTHTTREPKPPHESRFVVLLAIGTLIAIIVVTAFCFQFISCVCFKKGLLHTYWIRHRKEPYSKIIENIRDVTA